MNINPYYQVDDHPPSKKHPCLTPTSFQVRFRMPEALLADEGQFLPWICGFFDAWKRSLKHSSKWWLTMVIRKNFTFTQIQEDMVSNRIVHP